MNIRNIAIAVAVAATGFATSGAFAQDRDVTITHQRPDGAVVTKHIRSDGDQDGVVHRTVRVDRPDGTTVVRRSTRYRGDDFGPRMHRTVVVRHRYQPMRHVIVRDVQHRPAYVVNRRVTVVHDAY